MIHFRILLGLALVLSIASCSKTTVILVPDPQGNVGKVQVTPLIGEGQLLQSSGESIDTYSFQLFPAEPELLDPENLPERFQEMLLNEPEQAIHFLLYFHSGSTKLDDESAAKIHSILDKIRERKSCDIVSIGHTDTVGDVSYNIGLSTERAESVKQILVTAGVKEDCIRTISYGEKDPLIQTDDNVSEKANRRVGVEIR